MRKIEYNKNEEVGNNCILFIEEVEKCILPSGEKRRRALFLCTCGNEFLGFIKSVKSGNTSSCGCKRSENLSKSHKKLYVKNDTINGFIFIQEIEGNILPSGALQRKAEFVYSCGNHFITGLHSIIQGQTKSYGCKHKRAIKHGLSKHPLFVVWSGMKGRCYNRNADRYKDYGGRGITICNEWHNDFKTFYDWAIENGWAKGLQIDRENNNGNYNPSNCRFVTPKENANNRRNNRNV